jgi:hypothetical protein
MIDELLKDKFFSALIVSEYNVPLPQHSNTHLLFSQRALIACTLAVMDAGDMSVRSGRRF